MPPLISLRWGASTLTRTTTAATSRAPGRSTRISSRGCLPSLASRRGCSSSNAPSPHVACAAPAYEQAIALRPPRPLSPAGPSPQRLTSLPSRPFPGGTVADYWLTSRPPPSFVLDCRKYYIVVLRTSARRRRRRSDKTRDAIIRGVGKIYFWPLMPETMSSTRRMSDAASIAVLTVCTLTA